MSRIKKTHTKIKDSVELCKLSVNHDKAGLDQYLYIMMMPTLIIDMATIMIHHWYSDYDLDHRYGNNHDSSLVSICGP